MGNKSDKSKAYAAHKVTKTDRGFKVKNTSLTFSSRNDAKAQQRYEAKKER